MESLDTIKITRNINASQIIVLHDTIIQKRKHKKKRINKKWRKRYGYEIIPNKLGLERDQIILDEFNGYIYMNEETYHDFEILRSIENGN